MTSSLPPHLLRRPGSAPGSGARGRGDDAPVQLREPQRLIVSAGEPGEYDPELSPADRPVNITVLREAAQPATQDPWPAGSYVLVGTSGKRAHWTGDEWKSGVSPGYAAPADRSEPEQSDTLVATDADAAGESLPDAPDQDGPDQLEHAPAKPSGGRQK